MLIRLALGANEQKGHFLSYSNYERGEHNRDLAPFSAESPEYLQKVLKSGYNRLQENTVDGIHSYTISELLA